MAKTPAAAADATPAEETRTVPASVVAGVVALLHNIEFSAVGDGGSTRCPVCKQSPALDPANPRDFEGHTAECDLGTAIAGLEA